MKVKYWWTESGEAEICERIEGVLRDTAECYHCLAKLQKNERVSILTCLQDNDQYIMCVACAEKSTQII